MDLFCLYQQHNQLPDHIFFAAHTDKPHLHNHFVINVISFVDGKRYCNTKIGNDVDHH